MPSKSHTAPRRVASRNSRSNGTSTNNHDSGANEDEYEVERVVGKKYDENCNVSYLLKWKNWDGSPTWEPEQFCSCTQLINQYEELITRKERPSTSHDANGRPETPGPSSSPSIRTKSTPKKRERR